MLKEDTVYLRLTTYHDLVHDATHLMVLELLDEWNRAPFTHYQDLTMRGRPRPLDAQLLVEKLHAPTGRGIHQELRFKLWRETGGPVRSLEFNAGGHPYTGAYHTHLDIRVEKDWFVRNPEVAPRVFTRHFKRLAQMTHPFQAHAHDTDDNSIQNIGNPALLRRGFGLDVEGPIDLAENPGRELSRGEFRYVVNWLTLFGPTLLSQLGPEIVESVPVGTLEALDIDAQARRRPAQIVAERMGADPDTLEDGPPRWLLLTLGDSPLGAEEAARRDAQRAARDHLGFRALAEKTRYMLGYWQRKS